MTPTWYDLLGVEPDASTEQIRAAWKSAIADLDPGDRRFRSLNEAAEVLLDADRRAAYDATIEPEPEPAAEPEAGAETPDGAGTTPSAAPSAVTDLAAEKAKARAAKPRLLVPAWLLAGLAVLVAALLGCAGYLLKQPSDDAVSEATSQAQGQAEKAAATILAYDYRHLDADQKAADALMTSSYRKDYDKLFTQIAANAPDLKAEVTTKVLASGVVRSGDDRVQVLVFVDRPTLRKDLTEPQVYRDQVVLTMVKQDGDWLVDDMDTNQLQN